MESNQDLFLLLEPLDQQKKIVTSAAVRLGVNAVMLGIVEHGELTTEYIWRGEEEITFSHTFEAGHGLLGWVMLYRTPYHCRSIAQDPQIDSRLAEQLGDSAALVVPIMSQKRDLLGVLLLAEPLKENGFSEHHIEAAEKIASEAAQLLEQQRLVDEARLKTRTLETLLNFTLEINRLKQSDEIIAQLLRHSLTLLGGSSGLGGVIEGNRLIPTIWIKENRQAEDHPSYPAGSGFGAWVRREQQLYLCQDIGNDPFTLKIISDFFGAQQAVAIPLIFDATVLGWIELYLSRPDGPPLSWDDVWPLSSLANTAAVALHNGEMIGQLEQEQAELRSLAAQLVNRTEAERARLARELHDEAGQELMSIRLALQLLATEVVPKEPTYASEFEAIKQQINRAAKRLSAVSYGLRPPTLDQLGLRAALEQLVNEQRMQTALDLRFEMVPFADRLPIDIEITLFRLVQEGLTNIVRHAAATRVEITLEKEVRQGQNGLRLIIMDNGKGFEPEKIRPKALGLLGMRERVLMLNGRFEIDSTPGKGTRLSAVIPIVG